MSGGNETNNLDTGPNNELISSKFIVLLERCEILQHSLDQEREDDSSSVARLRALRWEMNQENA